MNRYWLYAVCLLCFASFAAGCAGVQNVLKSGDPEQMYSSALEYYGREKWTKASTLLEAVEPYYMGTLREDSIAFFNARCKFKGRDYETAATMLDDFRSKFGRSVFIEEAQGMYVLCFYFLSPEPTRDQSMTRRAIVAANEFMSSYPDSQYNDQFRMMDNELTGRLHEKAYLNAYTYYKIERYKSAIAALKNALRRYPDSRYREQIMYLIVKSSHKLASNSVERKQADRYLSMLDSYYSFVAEYPQSEQRAELDKLAEDAKNYLDKNNKDQQ